jgi:hypothetical protein
MAHEPHFPRRPEELIAAIARNREELAAQHGGLRRSMDVGERLQHSFHQNAGIFLGTAAVIGLLLALIPSSRRAKEHKYAHAIKKPAPQDDRKRKTESKPLAAVLLGLAGKVAIDMGKPMLLKMLREHYLSAHQRAATDAETRQPSDTTRS